MGAIGSQNTSLTIVYSTVYQGTDQSKHQSSASLAFVRGINRWTVNSPHKGQVTQNMFPFYDVTMKGIYFASRHLDQWTFNRNHVSTQKACKHWSWRHVKSCFQSPDPFRQILWVGNHNRLLLYPAHRDVKKSIQHHLYCECLSISIERLSTLYWELAFHHWMCV